ncbi:putative peptidase [Rubripirellula obstinata]|uniref:Putative peptidase n=1 Tax=Rubripirellula obstinata TaxID=406547 RepID=A0A5B1CEC3_9BACT|nr:Xaa-Pro peptidase family protein [Rubripirellula obstinata]KAA1257813.1 putative peptidase [Rubripirellula obstinata]
MVQTSPDYPARIERVRSRLVDIDGNGNHCDGFLITDILNVRYLTGFTGSSGYLLVTDRDAVILSDGRYDVQLARQCPSMTKAIRPPTQKITELAVEVIADLKLKTVAVEAADLTLAAMSELSTESPDTTWLESSGVVELFRQIKDEYEIGLIRSAADIAQRSLTKTLAGLNEQTTERQFALDLENAMRMDSADGVSFDIIAGFGETGGLPHYRPADRALANHQTVLIDWGACVSGYASDITRTFHRDGASDRFRSAYEAVLEANLAAIDAIRPGASCASIDAVARDVLRKHGLADAFLHSLGHGIGLFIHEGPRLAEISTETLQPGMVVTVEPGVYFAGDFGIRIEDDVLVTPDGAEVMTSLPKGLDDCRLML